MEHLYKTMRQGDTVPHKRDFCASVVWRFMQLCFKRDSKLQHAMLPCQLRLELERVGPVQWLWDFKEDAHDENYTESKLWRNGLPESNK